jgi:O-antigen/teichoic acid export membrane protein
VPYFGATVSNLVSLQLDIILVVSLFSTEAAGIYAVASALADGQTALGEALGITAFGVLSNEGNDGNRKKIITETFRQSALISSGAGAALACMIPFLVVPFFGARFEQAVRPAVILALAGSVAASASILNQALRGVGRPHAGLVSQLLSAAVLALTALLLFRPLGLVGVALAVCVSAITQLLVLIAAAAKWLAISPSGFWPFGTENIKILFQQLVDLRLKHLRLPA